jgi:tetratricopeptide (TPR) repeat protein
LLLLAAGHREQGAKELLELTKAGQGLAEQRLRIAGAALLARKRDRDAALTLLEGDAPALVTARRLVEGRRPLPGEIASARAGAAELMVRVAGDLYRQNINDLALRMARIATFLAPGNSETWLVTADLLAARQRHGPALAALAQVDPSDPFTGAAQDSRIKLLVDAGRQQEALALAQAAASASGATAADWTRLGMLLSELERQNEAAQAFERALQLRATSESAHTEWTLRLLKGGALEQAGRWPEAKAELEAAYKLAPDQPVVLNYLGYAQLERRENVEEATKLVVEASRLAPDSAEITDSLGWAYFLRGELPKAIELLERAAAAAPADPEINEHLGDAYYKGGRRFEARYAWKAALVYAEGKDATRIRTKIETGLTPELASP